jgi:hypothetical protein
VIPDRIVLTRQDIGRPEGVSRPARGGAGAGRALAEAPISSHHRGMRQRSVLCGAWLFSTLLVLGCGDDPVQNRVTFRIEGRVVGFDQLPAEGSQVFVAGQEVAVDGEARFRIDGIAPPYDVTILSPYRRGTWLYRGLTRPDPILAVETGRRLTRRATVHGHYPPLGAGGGRSVLAFEGREVEGALYRGCGFADGEFESTIDWPAGVSTLHGRLILLEWSEEQSLPTDYRGVATRDVILESGQSYEADLLPPDFAVPDTTSISGRADAPGGYVHVARWLFVQFGGKAVEIASQRDGQGLHDAFRYVVPNLPGITFGVRDSSVQAAGTDTASCTTVGTWDIAPGASNLELRTEIPDHLLAPADGATGVDLSTGFAWSRCGTGIHILHIQSANRLDPTFHVVQMETTATIPRVTIDGYVLPADHEYSFDIERVFPCTSIDGAATLDFVRRYARAENGDTHTEPRRFRTGAAPSP